jgi:hypothetical protein
MAGQLARAVLAAPVPGAISAGSIDLPWELLPPGIAHVWFWASIDGVDSLWQPLQGGWVAGIPPAAIEKLIEAKGRKLAAYREKCTEVWLVLSSITSCRAHQQSSGRTHVTGRMNPPSIASYGWNHIVLI